GHNQAPPTAGNVPGERFYDAQRAHRIHVENANPIFVIDIPGPLPRHPGSPRIVDEQIDCDRTQLLRRTANALRAGHVHWDRGEPGGGSPRHLLQLPRSRRVTAGGKYLPFIGAVLMREFEADPTIGTRNQNCGHLAYRFSNESAEYACPRESSPALFRCAAQLVILLYRDRSVKSWSGTGNARYVLPAFARARLRKRGR